MHPREASRRFVSRHTIPLFLAMLVLLLASVSCETKENKSNLPALPIDVGYRSGVLGIVARLTNTSEGDIAFSAWCWPKPIGLLKTRDPTATKEFRIFLKPGEHKEIGWVEGWMFEPGELLKLYAPGYQTTEHHITNPPTRL